MLVDAVGRVLADDVASAIALPPFDHAAMDGFALASRGNTVAAGSEWPVEACIAAGDAPHESGVGALEIMTGAMLPDGADAVIPVERIERLVRQDAGTPPRIRLLSDVPPGANVRRRGEDVREGQLLARAGEYLRAPAILLLAGLGIDRIDVARRPRVALLATGRELVGQGVPLTPGRIYDASSPYLAIALAEAGAELVHIEHVGDDVPTFRSALDAALSKGADLVLSTGAVSKGRYDFVPRALTDRGASLVFHGVAIRPGKPVLCAHLREGPLFVGLPGNPLSSAVGLRFLVEPLLRVWLGMPDETPHWLPLARPCGKKRGLHACFHASVRCDHEGRMRVHVSQQQESFRLLPLLRAPAWITLPEALEEASAGQPVQVHGRSHLHPPHWEMEPHA